VTARADGGTGQGGLVVLAVDDEVPALEEVAWLLRADPRVAVVHTASGPAEALRLLESQRLDAVFLDIRMPGLTGLDLARLLGRFSTPPAVVFVTAHDDAAVHAFDVGAVDYVLKPVRRERLAEAVRRVEEAVRGAGTTPAPAHSDETIAVELAGTTRFVPRSEVLRAEAAGDYARLHTSDGSHLVRVPLATLEERWGTAGFVRVHRSHLVAVQHVTELRSEPGRVVVVVGGVEIAVSRRHTRVLRERLVGAMRGGGAARAGGSS
jgi:DNA-binding LytR/AlgR family response regulator